MIELATARQLVIVDFPGAQGMKRRPAVILSSDEYHRVRPDIIVGLITSNIAAANGPTDYVLQDWQAAGLHTQSAFRAYLVTLPRSAITALIGSVSNLDWTAISDCVTKSLAT